MEFECKKDIVISFLLLGTAFMLIVLLSYDIYANGISKFDMIKLLVVPFIFILIWFWIDTKYCLKYNTFIYKSGPIRGSIKVNSIQKVVRCKMPIIGIKPALSTSGLIIKYNKYDEIYIAPKDRENFIQAILSLNPEILIEG